MLESYPEWKEPIPVYDDDFDAPKRMLLYQIRSFLVERSKTKDVYSWMSKQHFWGRWMPENPDHNSVFCGEFYWALALRRHESIFYPRSEERRAPLAELNTPLIFTSDTYGSQMNSFDCSSDLSFRIFLPGAWLVERMKLRWNGREGHFFDSKGTLIAFDPAVVDRGPNAFLIRKDVFFAFLKSEGYDVIWFVLGGKQVLGGWSGHDTWPGELQISGSYRIEGRNVVGTLRPAFVGRDTEPPSGLP